MLTELTGSRRNHVANVQPFSYGQRDSGGITIACGGEREGQTSGQGSSAGVKGKVRRAVSVASDEGTEVRSGDIGRDKCGGVGAQGLYQGSLAVSV